MKSGPDNKEARLALVQGILEGAFFTPLHVNDWPAFFFAQPGLLSMEEDEVFDLFLRAALAARTIYPRECEGRRPLAWLLSLPDPPPVLAQVLASLRHDRPFLFHRILFSLPAVRQGKLDPDRFELVEDFLAQALGEKSELREAAAGELEILRRRALAAAGADPEGSDPALAAAAERVLALKEASGIRSDSELLMWLSMGEGLQEVKPEMAPAVMVEVWSRWVASVIGAPPDVALLGRLLPALDLAEKELDLYAPPPRQAGHQIQAACPVCSATVSLHLGSEVEQLADCPHLIFVGTSDEVHLLNVLSHFDLGQDFLDLMASYYNSPADLELFGTIINDLYEMLRHQGRLHQMPVSIPGAAKGYHYLRAYFISPRPEPGEQEFTH